MFLLKKYFREGNLRQFSLLIKSSMTFYFFKSMSMISSSMLLTNPCARNFLIRCKMNSRYIRWRSCNTFLECRFIKQRKKPNQKNHYKELLKRFGMNNEKSTSTTMSTLCNLDSAEYEKEVYKENIEV